MWLSKASPRIPSTKTGKWKSYACSNTPTSTASSSPTRSTTKPPKYPPPDSELLLELGDGVPPHYAFRHHQERTRETHKDQHTHLSEVRPEDPRGLGLPRGTSLLTQEKNVCHRDIKPSNILIDEDKAKVQICDFGSAKQLKKGEGSITYICSRYYRAPELILGNENYSSKIDIWAAGCVIAEMVTCLPLFNGDNNVDQLAKIIRVLGPPTQQDLLALNVGELDAQFDQLAPVTLPEKIRKGNSQCPPLFIDLLQKLIVYNPNNRLSARQALSHPLFTKPL
jgi:serine/threonine protein kinase